MYMPDDPKGSGKQRSTLRTPSYCTLKIELMPDIKPVIWRRLEVDGRVSLGKLHHFIQAAFGWTDAHIHEFKVHKKIYRVPNPVNEILAKDERKAILVRVLGIGDVFSYVYGFCGNWEHIITVEDFTAGDDNNLRGGATVTGGAMASPPEEVGGPSGYHDFLEKLLTNPSSEEAQEMRNWIGGKFDPKLFDLRSANAAIYRLMYNRWCGK